jgi:hypothetical protein
MIDAAQLDAVRNRTRGSRQRGRGLRPACTKLTPTSVNEIRVARRRALRAARPQSGDYTSSLVTLRANIVHHLLGIFEARNGGGMCHSPRGCHL